MPKNSFLSFQLSDEFIAEYADKKVEWGLKDAGGTSFSEIVFLRSYSRVKEDGSKETWQDVCRRVVEGTYSIQKDWAKSHHLPWNDHKAAKSAQEMFARMFAFKWSPPGRGLATMGTRMVNEVGYSTSLQNCGATALGKMSKNNPGRPFAWLMSASMMGVGIGYSTIGVEKLDIRVSEPTGDMQFYTVPDSREGWAESTRLLINSFLTCNGRPVEFDYSEIRPKGALIKSFGTAAPGPLPLIRLHDKLVKIFGEKIGQPIDAVLMNDVANLIGKCVVSGNTRRSALLSYGELNDKDFVNLKNWQVYPERNGADGWAWMSNNSVRAHADSDLTPIIDNIVNNGEPGIVWEDVVRSRGRLSDVPDDKDARFACFNPCFHPDTIIETVDGPKRIIDITDPTLVYTRDSEGKLTTRKASAAFLSRKDARTIRVGLQNGTELIVTPEHKLMRRDGTWVEARFLQPGDLLEVFSRTRRGWRYSGVRIASQPIKEQVMEHRFIWESVYGSIPEGYDVDHINRDHNDNRIENLRLLPHAEHSQLSRTQVPNNHQVHAANGDFAPSGLHGVKPLSGAIMPDRATRWRKGGTVTYVTEGPISDVYDLTVEDTHCMIANNVVAHNCAEQPLEDFEFCTLADVYVNNHESLEDFKRTIKFAFLYTKTVTLLPTHFEESNAVMQRNRRIGLSVSGVTDFVDSRLNGLQTLRSWWDEGYKTVRTYDKAYSEWLCVRESSRVTTVKPGGTTSLVAATSAGVHWTDGGEFYTRALRMANDDPMLPALRQSGRVVEPDVMNPETTVVVYFPIRSRARRSARQVSLFEKAALAVEAQRLWSDNGVSVTLTFDPERESGDVATVLNMYAGQLKAVSFLPVGNTVYPQQPYTEITEDEYAEASMTMFPALLEGLYADWHGADIELEAGCTTDACEVKTEVASRHRMS